MQAYRTITAAMMRIIIPVTSPPRYTPTSIAVFDVSGSLASCCSGAMVGLGSSTCDSGVQIAGLGFSICGSGVEVGIACGSGTQKGLHTLTMVAV